MKAKTRKGGNILYSEGVSNNWDELKDSMIINLMNKYTYISFKQFRNHLLINTTEGEVDIVFTGEIPLLLFDYFVKNQLVLKITK